MTGITLSLRTLLGRLVALALFVMMILTVLDVIGRHVVNRPFPGALL